MELDLFIVHALERAALAGSKGLAVANLFESACDGDKAIERFLWQHIRHHPELRFSSSPTAKQRFTSAQLTTMDVEEAQASGCALMCATLSPKFNVKPFEVVDCCQYPVNVSWEQPDVVAAEDDEKMDVDEDGEDGSNSVSSSGTNVLTLFPRNGAGGTRKIAFRRNKVSIPRALNLSSSLLSRVVCRAIHV